MSWLYVEMSILKALTKCNRKCNFLSHAEPKDEVEKPVENCFCNAETGRLVSVSEPEFFVIVM